MMPLWTPLADPDQPDPADLTYFQHFTATNLPDVEDPLDAAAQNLVAISAAADAEALVMDALGSDLTSAFDQLSSFAAEEDANTFVDEITAAAAGDAAIADMLRQLAPDQTGASPTPPADGGTPVNNPPPGYGTGGGGGGGVHIYAPPF